MSGPALLFQQVGVELVHVPYKGNSPATSDLLAGQLALAMLSPANILGHVRSGKLRALVVMDGKRLKDLPDAPSLAEAGFPEWLRFEWGTWNAVFAPAATPRPVIEQLHAAIARTIEDPQVLKALADIGSLPMPGSQADAQQFVANQFRNWVPELRRMKLD